MTHFMRKILNGFAKVKCFGIEAVIKQKKRMRAKQRNGEKQDLASLKLGPAWRKPQSSGCLFLKHEI
jgi:hypothetical protein